MKARAALQASCYLLFALAVVGCHPDMWTQPKFKAQDKSDFFADHSSSRLPVQGTVKFESKDPGEAVARGYINGKLVEQFPVPVTAELIERGQERFSIFCRHCHGAIGDGKGMISQRGFNVERPIASYHTDRLRKMPVGHFFDVVTNGYGAMYPFSDRISVEDRWAIVAYIRVLQKSQNATINEVPAELRPFMSDPAEQLKSNEPATEEAH